MNILWQMKLLRSTLVLSFVLINGEFISKSSQVKLKGSEVSEVRMSDAVTDDDKTSYRGYLIRKRVRKVEIDEPLEGSQPYFADDEYATLIRDGRTVLRFDGMYEPMGNSMKVGLFSFLGASQKQFIVSQDTFRGGNQWVVTLQRGPRVIYDGRAWKTGREVDDMSLVDLDNDGVYEISVPTCIFYGFESLCPGCTPLPTIIFKYSNKTGRYLPANRQFAHYLLANVEDQKQKVQSVGSPLDNMNHLSGVLTVVLDYVFAGRAHEAWTFYDRAYKLPDKHKIKKEIRAKLRESPVYRFIYSKHTSRPKI